MPFINTKVTVPVSKEKELAIKAAFGKAITAIRGKSEAWLMVCIEDNCRMYFRGEGDLPCAFIEVKLYGKASGEEYELLTEKLSDIISRNLNINSDRIYIKYDETAYWGFNGHNF